MKIEYWALLISVVALLISIGVPVWQRRSQARDRASSQRTLLLQKILAARSTTFLSSIELRNSLDRYGKTMEPIQKANLESEFLRMEQHHDAIENLHNQWNDPEAEHTLEEIQRELRLVDRICAEAEDTAQLIQAGKRSYKEA